MDSPSQILLAKKQEKNLTFKEIATHLNCSEIYAAAVLFGQSYPTPEQALVLSKLLDTPVPESSLTAPEAALCHTRCNPGTATFDPVIHRLNEMISLYGLPIRAIIHEKFGDGVMSAVDCKVKVEEGKSEVEGERRVLLSIDGKFLPYKPF